MPRRVPRFERRRRMTEQRKVRAMKWRSRGFSLAEIGHKLGVSGSRVSQILSGYYS